MDCQEFLIPKERQSERESTRETAVHEFVQRAAGLMNSYNKAATAELPDDVKKIVNAYHRGMMANLLIAKEEFIK